MDSLKKSTLEKISKYIYSKSREVFDFTKATEEESQNFKSSFPLFISHHELLRDFDWVYKYAEFLFKNIYYYWDLHGTEEYYTLFKAITRKYDMEKDYQRFLQQDGQDKTWLRDKWEFFAIDMIDYFCSSNPSIDELSTKPDFIDYFFRYPEIYTPSILSRAKNRRLNKIFESERIVPYYINHSDEFFSSQLINSEIGKKIFFDTRFIRNVARTSNILDFYEHLRIISRFSCELPYIDEHKRFCDEEVTKIDDGILSVLFDEYSKAPDYISKQYYTNEPLNYQILRRVLKIYDIKQMPKRLFFQCLSKYYLIGFFMSRHFETDPYNLLIDIDTLYQFAKKHSNELKGFYIYEFLLFFEEYDLEDILKIYESAKKLPLKEMLYDDWQQEKTFMVDDINSSLCKLENLPLGKTCDGITYRDIDDFDSCILVTNTCIDIQSKGAVQKLLKDVLSGQRGVECLSFHDSSHKGIYRDEEEEGQTSIKFIMGPLDSKRVGIVYHRDAYSKGITEIEPYGRKAYKRKLFTAQELLNWTTSYNEITHLASGEPFLPVGVLVEETITDIEKEVADTLGVPIYFRPHRMGDQKSYYIMHRHDSNLYRHYVYAKGERRLFNP